VNIRRPITIAACATLSAIFLTGCGVGAQQVDSSAIGLKYSNGSFDGKNYEGVVAQGETQWVFNDEVRQLPTSLRGFRVQRSDTADINDVLTVPVSGGPVDQTTGRGSTALVDFELATSFVLNTNTDDIPGYDGGTLRLFSDKLCKTFDCYLDNGKLPEGWSKLLKDRYYPWLEAAFKDEARKEDPDKVVDNVGGVTTELQGRVAALFSEYLNKQLNAKFFCGPTFDPAKTDCPNIELKIISADYNNPDVRRAREASKVASLNAEAQSKLEEPLKDPNYLRYLEIQAAEKCAINPNGNCVLSFGNTPVAVAPQPR